MGTIDAQVISQLSHIPSRPIAVMERFVASVASLKTRQEFLDRIEKARLLQTVEDYEVELLKIFEEVSALLEP